MSLFAGPSALAFHRAATHHRFNKTAAAQPGLVVECLGQGRTQDQIESTPNELALRSVSIPGQNSKSAVLVNLKINLFAFHFAHRKPSYTILYIVRCRSQQLL